VLGEIVLDYFDLMSSVTTWIRSHFEELQKMANLRKLCLICAQVLIIQIQGKGRFISSLKTVILDNQPVAIEHEYYLENISHSRSSNFFSTIYGVDYM
jgi:hypothetical protein